MPTPEARAEELFFNGAFIFKALPDPHIVVDEQFRIRHLNRRAREVFGYTHEEIDNQPIGMVFEDTRLVKEFMSSPPGVDRGLEVVRRKSGTLFMADIAMGSIPWGNDPRQRRAVVRIKFLSECART